MGTVVSHWRATYTPGEWLVLSGPTAMVLLEPPGPEWSNLVNTLWETVVASSSLPELASRLAEHGIDELPSLAALFWTADGMRSLVRGDVSVVDLNSGDVVARGEGIQTWSEVGLDGVRQVRVEAHHGGDEAPIALPLVVGAARVSSVTLDASEDAKVSSPQGAPGDAISGLAATEALPEVERESAPDGPAATEALPELELDPEPIEMINAPEEDVQWAFWNEEPAPPSEPVPPVEPAPPDVLPLPPGYDAEALARLENADTALMASPPPPAPPPELSQDSLIMAVVCHHGHASPQNASLCRICGSPIAPQGPVLIPRPVLAVLRSSDGATAVVDRAVLIGRAPSGHLSSARAPRLMTVPSPSHDISRTHVEVAPDGWQIAVTDLDSTNGTVLVRPGATDRQQLTAGEPVLVQLGSVVELGDGISVLIDFPQ